LNIEVFIEVVRSSLPQSCLLQTFLCGSLFKVSEIKYFNSKQHFVHNCFPDVVLIFRSKLTCLAFTTTVGDGHTRRLGIFEAFPLHRLFVLQTGLPSSIKPSGLL